MQLKCYVFYLPHPHFVLGPQLVMLDMDEPSADSYHICVHRSRLVALLISPSLLSFSVSFVLSAIILSVAGWSYIRSDSGLHEYLFGPYGLTTILQNSANALAAVNGAFSSPTAYNVAVAIFAIFAGLSVYTFLEGVDHVTAKTTGALQEVELITDEKLKKQAEHRAELRTGLRLVTLIVWICYLIFFARVIVPSCLLVARLDISNYLLTWHNVVASLIGFGLLLVALHINVFFMRLVMLRPRVFGGDVVGRGGHEE